MALDYLSKKIQHIYSTSASPGFSNSFYFKQQFTIQQRIQKRVNLENKYTGPRDNGVAYIVLQGNARSKLTGQHFSKKPFKLLAVDKHLAVWDLCAYIRKIIKLDEKSSLFIIVNNTIANNNYQVGDLHDLHTESDGFLYLSVSETDVF